MVGTVVEAKPAFPRIIFVLLVLALLVLGRSFMTGNLALAFGALPFLLPIPLLLLTRPRPIKLELLSQGVVIEHPFQEIPWSDLTCVRRQFRHQNPRKTCASAFNLELHHQHGAILIPSPSQPETETLFQGFFATLSPSGSRQVAPELQPNLEKWLTTFGEDKVFSFCARQKLFLSTFTWNAMLFLGMLAGIILMWVIIAMLSDARHQGDLLVGVISLTATLLLVGLLILLLGLSGQNAGGHRQVKAWKKAGLVISPAGLAMSQGNTVGEMRWSEVLDIVFQKKNTDGIMIKVAGAQFQIYDLYDRPLYLIYQHLMRYWSNKEV